MDAVAYQVSFDKEQLSLLCANYDRRIDSLGEENKVLCGHICDLEAENAKLHDMVVRLQSVVSDGADNARELRAENAKLRELVAHAWGLFLEHGAVHPCDLPEVDAVRDEIRELGVEVASV